MRAPPGRPATTLFETSFGRCWANGLHGRSGAVVTVLMLRRYQVLAWALVFGYAQQLSTRLVDQQGHTVLDSVRGAGGGQVDPT